VKRALGVDPLIGVGSETVVLGMDEFDRFLTQRFDLAY
jgi:hypothetical protein